MQSNEIDAEVYETCHLVLEVDRELHLSGFDDLHLAFSNQLIVIGEILLAEYLGRDCLHGF